MIRAALPILLLLPGCTSARPAPATTGGGVVSLDYCADQMVLGLVPRSRLLAVSPEADSDAAFSVPRAHGIPRLRPTLEEIQQLRPAYAVRLYGGAPGIDRQLTRLGIKVIQLGMVGNLDQIAPEVRRIGAALGEPARADALAATFARDVNAARANLTSSRQPTLLYMTPGDVTTGPDTLVGEVIATAGFQSVRSNPGWGSLPVEAMVRRPPDAVLRAFFDSPRYRQDRWSAAAHPRLRAIVAATPTATVAGSTLACGNWLTGKAVRTLTGLRMQLAPAS